MSRPIIVGVDGSPGAEAALRWAVPEGQRLGQPVVALLAWSFLDQAQPEPDGGFDPGYREEDAKDALDGFVDRALGPSIAGAVGREVVCDLPVRALTEASHRASLMVVGARGSGGFEGLLLGSTSDRLLQHSAAPVAIVRGAGGAGGVVAGVDGSATGDAALRWAVAEARRRGCALEVVHVWHRPAMAVWTFLEESPVFEKLAEAATDLLDRAVDRVDTAGIEVRRTVIEGSAAGGLLDSAKDAALLVVGSRGLSPLVGAALGSIGRQVAHHAPCPVVLVPPQN